MAFKLLFLKHPSFGRGATLLTVTLENVPTTSKPKHSMLPLLVVLFLISYGLLATLVVEQNRTISAQRSLLNQMLGDSMQLAAMKKAATQHAIEKALTPQATPHDKSKPGKLQRYVPQKPPKDASDTPDVRRNLVSI
jgi:hypothetical protein